MILRASATLLALLFPTALFAQASGTGAVTGRVTDSSGGVLPGVTVTMKSPAALGQFTAVTDAQGLYRIVNLAPAAYEVRAELQGFQTVVQQVAVRVASTQVVDFSLAVGAMTETVNVTAETPIVDPERSGLSINISNEALTQVPISTQRRYQDVWALAPGVFVRPDQADINPSVNSRGTSENSTKLDGMDVTDPFGGGVFSVSFNYDAIQDIQIKTLGAEAEDGGRTGGFMSIVTKSGGNDVHGSAAFFVFPQKFNSSNIDGVPPNQRKSVQPDFTLGGPIMKNRIWFFSAYRRVQEDQTVNNAHVPLQPRGNQIYLKGTGEIAATQRVSFSFQWDRTNAVNAVLRTTGTGAPSTTAGLSSATPALAAPSAWGKLVTGGPLAGGNYTWVMRSNVLFQFIGSYMINKPQNSEPQGSLDVSKVIQTNSAGNITGSLTTIAQEGGFGMVDVSNRSMLYLYPSLSFPVNKAGQHDFKAGVELYPFLRNRQSRDITPIEFYYRPPGTTGAADVLIERDTFRSNGTGTAVSNYAYEHIYGGYFQDRWKPRPNMSVKAGVRIDSNAIFTQDREKVLGNAFPPGFPTVTSDQEFGQTTVAPNFGIAYDAQRFGVFRGTAGRYYEWLDLGGGDGTSHNPYVATTDVLRANPRTGAPVLNQSLPGAFALGVNYGQGNKKTYDNEFSASWEKSLPRASSFNATFVVKRTWDFQGTDDMNIVRDPNTGALLGRPFPAFDAVLRTYAPNYTFQQFRSLQLLYAKNFGQRWGMNTTYWYGMHQTIQLKFNPTRDTLQFLGFSPDDATNEWVTPRHQARASSYVRLAYGLQLSGLYTFTAGPRSDILTGLVPLNSTAPTIVLSNGRSVSDPFWTGTAANAFPRAGRRGVDMLIADNVHLFNVRVQKSFELGPGRKIEVSGDAFNLFNSGAAFGFLSADERSANFGVKTNFVQPRAGQLGVRVVF